MDPFELETYVARPREEVFGYLADIANHPEFCDHFLTEWHLTREDPVGLGAGARFRVRAPANRFGWADLTLAEVTPPRRILARGRGGKFNRIRVMAEYTLEPASGGTRVQLRAETAPALATDRLMEALGARRWLRRRCAKALRRLRAILEDDRERGRRATIAGR